MLENMLMMWLILEDKEQNRDISREVNDKWSTREVLDIFDSRLYHKVTICDRLSKITHFVATTKEILAKGLARLFRNNIWKLHRLPESVILNRGLQFVVDLTK